MGCRISVLKAVAAGCALGLCHPVAQAADSSRPPAAAIAAAPDHAAAPATKRRSLLRFADPRASVECKVKSPAYEGRAPLRAVRRAILQNRPLRVVALGSSSTVGIGATSARAAYPVRLENDLEGVVEGLQVEMFARGQAGDVAAEATDRIKAEVAEIRPDLVVWQVGTADAVARIDAQTFGAQLRDTLSWLASHRIDVVLIDPQYVERLSGDKRYTSIVNEVATVASEMRVLLVNRYDAMADLARQNAGSSNVPNDHFQLSDLGYRCMAEYAAKAIAAGILQADTENGAMH